MSYERFPITNICIILSFQNYIILIIFSLMGNIERNRSQWNRLALILCFLLNAEFENYLICFLLHEFILSSLIISSMCKPYY